MAKPAAKTKAEGGEEIATVRIELVDSDPPIWREVEVPTAFTLTDLHDVVQAAMGWEDYHLWEFTIARQSYMPPMEDDFGFGPPSIDPDTVRLRELLRPRRTTIEYLYDFGDGWEHRMTVTRIRAGEAGMSFPRYVGGENAAPPEDSGGIYGPARQAPARSQGWPGRLSGGGLEFLDQSGHLAPMAAYAHPFAVAPMMDWTDRHCRFFHRQLTRRALLYTEMIVADAVIRGDRARLLAFAPQEHPVALQLGGAEPDKLAQAAEIAAELGYDEVNLNVGCPSDRVQSGTFGACLMRQPALVGACVKAMKAAVDIPVTVKCRIGVDDQDPEAALDALADAVLAAGADAVWVHARKAWLDGLSPKENRDVPPLDYQRVYRLKARLPDAFVGINGGIASLAEAQAHLEHVDGAMLGRAAYRTPAILAEVDRAFYGAADAAPEPEQVALAMAEYAKGHTAAGGRLSAVTRHMIGLFPGRPGARRWRQILSTGATRPGAGPDIILRAIEAVGEPARRPALSPLAGERRRGGKAAAAAMINPLP